MEWLVVGGSKFILGMLLSGVGSEYCVQSYGHFFTALLTPSRLERYLLALVVLRFTRRTDYEAAPDAFHRARWTLNVN